MFLSADDFRKRECLFSNMSFMDACKFDELNLTPNKSFDIIFGENNEKMKNWITKMEEKYEKDKIAKEEEISISKNKHQDIQNAMKNLQDNQECTCYFEEDEETHEQIKMTCKRCKDVEMLRKQASNLKIKILEKVFPDCTNSKYAIAFEVWMPDEFAMLRNIVIILEKLAYEDYYGQHRVGKREWRQLVRRRSIFGTFEIKRGRVPCENNLHSTNDWATCSYGNEQHCTKKIDAFFVDCRCDVQSYKLKSGSNKCLVPDITSYQLKQLDLSEYSDIDIASYKSMQEFLSQSDELTQNDVLCKQEMCPSDMTLNNFILHQ